MATFIGFQSGQVLLTVSNFQDSLQRGNAQHTINELFKLGVVVPIMSETDVVGDRKERFGDNDQLSAVVSILIEADMLFLVTDVDGLYSINPNIGPHAHREPLRENTVHFAFVTCVKSRERLLCARSFVYWYSIHSVCKSRC